MGESERSLGVRIGEHKRVSKNTSAIQEHARANQHQLDWDNVKIIDK